jgi:hypothetical protein
MAVELYGNDGSKQAKERRFHKEILCLKKLYDMPIDTDEANQVKI